MRVAAGLVMLMLVAAACVPAQTPPQLAFTPGEPLVITDQQLDFGSFRLTYPTGWRVITGAAEASPALLLAAPDDAALISISPHEQTTPPPFNTLPVDLQVATQQQIDIAGIKVTFWLVTDQTRESEFRLILQQIIASITA